MKNLYSYSITFSKSLGSFDKSYSCDQSEYFNERKIAITQNKIFKFK